jgi:hypothetical protein
MGGCHEAPMVAIGHALHAHATVASVSAAVERGETHPHIPPFPSFDAYREGGGYRLLSDCLDGTRAVEDILQLMENSGLRGLGGAGFPTGRKWRFVRAEPGPRLMAVNGDEGEPGTFKDRHYLETDPHRFLEGMLIAAWAVEAADVWIYLRDEYPQCREALLAEIPKLEAAGLTRKTRIHMRRGAGAYICGEESAMLESIEGKRGLPRHKPPFRSQVGLFGRPTLINTSRPCSGCATSSRGDRLVLLAKAAMAARACAPSRCRVASASRASSWRRPASRCGNSSTSSAAAWKTATASRASCPAAPPGAPAAALAMCPSISDPRSAWVVYRLRRGCHSVGPGRHARSRAQSAALLRGRVLRPVHAVPARHREGRHDHGA